MLSILPLAIDIPASDSAEPPSSPNPSSSSSSSSSSDDDPSIFHRPKPPISGHQPYHVFIRCGICKHVHYHKSSQPYLISHGKINVFCFPGCSHAPKTAISNNNNNNNCGCQAVIFSPLLICWRCGTMGAFDATPCGEDPDEEMVKTRWDSCGWCGGKWDSSSLPSVRMNVMKPQKPGGWVGEYVRQNVGELLEKFEMRRIADEVVWAHESTGS